jgi:hypothetical protein
LEEIKLRKNGKCRNGPRDAEEFNEGGERGGNVDQSKGCSVREE